MTTHYGYSVQDWNVAKEEMKGFLSDRAKVRGMIPYSELVQQLQSIRFEPDSYAFHSMLGEISREEDRAGRGMLSVIVVHKYGDMQPGPGFFGLAKELGRNTTDTLVCWIDELNKVHDYWSLPRDG